jgi:hypothetical protein
LASIAHSKSFCFSFSSLLQLFQFDFMALRHSPSRAYILNGGKGEGFVPGKELLTLDL